MLDEPLFRPSQNKVCLCVCVCVCVCVYVYVYIYIYTHSHSKTHLKWNLKGPEHFSAKARFLFNQGTLHIKIKPGHART